jgi:hypothetical protein
MLPSLERHPDKDIRAGGTADAATNWGEEVAGGEGGEFIFRTRVLASKSKRDQSDPRVAELSTPKKKKKCQRNMSDIFRKKYVGNYWVEHISKLIFPLPAKTNLPK